MRVWDLPVQVLCTQHLLGEHNEIHTIWNVITQGKKGFAHHPETMRWRGRLGALMRRHDELVSRLWHHQTPLDIALVRADGPDTWVQDRIVESVESQVRNIKAKGCKCQLGSLLDKIG